MKTAAALFVALVGGAQSGIVYSNSDITGLRRGRADALPERPLYSLQRQIETAFLIEDVGEVDVFVPMAVYNHTRRLRDRSDSPMPPQICLSLQRVPELFCLHPRHQAAAYEAMRLTISAEAVARSGGALAPNGVAEARWVVDGAESFVSSSYDLYIDMLEKRPMVTGAALRTTTAKPSSQHMSSCRVQGG